MIITCPLSPPPPCALWDRKWGDSDILYGPSRLGRNQDVLLGAGMIVSALAGRFVSLQVISWMDNDRYTFPAIFHFCRRGIRKTRDSMTTGPPPTAGAQLSSASERARQRHSRRPFSAFGHKTPQWPRDLTLEGVGWGAVVEDGRNQLQIREMEGGGR